MTTIADLFTQAALIDYSAGREYPAFLGDELFPSRRIESMKLDTLTRGTKTPILAPIAGFDTEAEIGSREANKMIQELALVKRKMQIKETDLYALLNPRTPQEGEYLKNGVYNDFDVLNQGVLAQAERMAMELLATGKVTLNADSKKAVLDYKLPSAHQQKAASDWSDASVDPLLELQNWCDVLDVTPTRAITSQKIYRAITRNPKVIAAVYGANNDGRLLGTADFDAFMQAQGLPVIRMYKNKYKVQNANGSYTSKTYWPEDKIALFNDDTLGEKVFGPTPEELANQTGVDASSVGNVYDTIYTETNDPVGTFEKATALVLPTLAAPEEIFQGTVTIA